MRVQRMFFTAIVIVLAGYIPVLAEGECSFDLTRLGTGEVPSVKLNKSCSSGLPEDVRAQILSTIQTALAEKNPQKLQNIKQHLTAIYNAYLGADQSFQSKRVLESLRSLLLEAWAGSQGFKVPPAESVTIEDVGELVDKLAAAVKTITPTHPDPAPSEPANPGQPDQEEEPWRIEDIIFSAAAVVLALGLAAAGWAIMAVSNRLSRRSKALNVRLQRLALAGRPTGVDSQNQSQAILNLMDARFAREWSPRLEELNVAKQQVDLRIEASDAELTRLREELARLAAEVATMAGGIASKMTESEAQLQEKRTLLPEGFLNRLEEAERAAGTKDTQPIPASRLVALERDLLVESWKKLKESNKDVAGAVDRSFSEKWKSVQQNLLVTLHEVVKNDEELRSAFDLAVLPVRDFDQLAGRLSLIAQLVDGEVKPHPNETTELLRVRENAHVVSTLLNTGLLAERLRFRLEKWASERFLSFADLFLQRHQQEHLKGTSGELEKGAPVVLELLGRGDLEPIDVQLGVTLFDSSQHVGRSTTSDPRMKNGVISGVIRNGFVRKSTGQVVRQPEVIVNRV